MPQLENKKEVSLVAQGSSRFGFGLYDKVIKPQENAIFSSHSVATVLSMASMGARGATLEEMRKVLHLPEDMSVLQKAYASITSCLSSDEHIKMEVANGMFPAKTVEIRSDFVSDILKYFSSDIESMDYNQTQAAVKRINDWVSTKTHDKIKDLFSEDSIDSDTINVLVNAIYFKGDWLEKFNPGSTENRAFHVSPELTVQAPTMYANMDIATQYSEDLKCDIIALPYKGDRMTMYILLPKEKFGLRELESKLCSESFDPSILSQEMFKGEKNIYLPKFKIESTHDLKEGLQKQGISQLFLRSCDLSGVAGAPGQIYVSKVFQKAMIEVNEEGSEAAAATGVTMVPCCLVIPENLVVDHPFAFMIRDNLTELTLFNGRVVNPLAT